MSRLHCRLLAAGLGAMILGLGSGALWAQARPGDVGFPYGDLKEVTLQGRIVLLQEELARKYGARATGGEKQWALALPEGQYYTFLDNDLYRRQVPPAAGTAVRVKARHFPRSMLLEVLEVRPTDGAALRRRFQCTVCAIFTEDFGPCVCCGREMELVRP